MTQFESQESVRRYKGFLSCWERMTLEHQMRCERKFTVPSIVLIISNLPQLQGLGVVYKLATAEAQMLKQAL